MRINPQVYGISLEEVEVNKPYSVIYVYILFNYFIAINLQFDPMLVNKRKEFITSAAMALDRAQMLRYNERTGDLLSTGSLLTSII